GSFAAAARDSRPSRGRIATRPAPIARFPSATRRSHVRCCTWSCVIWIPAANPNPQEIMSVSQFLSSAPVTLLELLDRSPSEQTAIILPEHHIRISYGELRRQVQAVAEQLAAAGVGR